MTSGPRVLPAPDADEARRLLQDELAKAAYVEAQPNFFERILGDLLRSIVDLLDGMRGLGAGPGTLVLAVGAALVVVVAVLLVKPRPNARGRRQETGVFDDDVRRSAAFHRARASLLAADGDWNGAVAEVLRAVIRSAEERVLIDEQPGRTATEAALRLGGAFPSLSSDIAWLSDRFNETHYGSGAATGEDYRRASSLDTRLTAERPSPAGNITTPAAPR